MAVAVEHKVERSLQSPLAAGMRSRQRFHISVA
jgi:hypothetical protein